MTSQDSKLKSYLAEHPRMIGALFTLSVLIGQAGTVVATKASATRGP